MFRQKSLKNKLKIKEIYFIFFIILLILTGLFFFLKRTKQIILKDTHSNSIQNVVPSHDSNEITINVYDATGQLQLNITSSRVQYCEDQKITWFLHPSIYILNKRNIIIWKIICDKATLNNQKILMLNGCVCINKILNEKCTQSIITNQAIINLLDQSMITNNITIIHGYHFYSIGSKMCSDLKTQTIKLFGKIYTRYEIKSIE